MQKFFRKHGYSWKQKNFIFSVLVGLLFLLISLIINYYAGTYATAVSSNPVTDIILSHIRFFDIDGLFIYGFVAFLFSLLLLFIYDPDFIPFTLKSIALFILVRSISISLTHIAPFPLEAPLNLGSILNKFVFQGDLFFSAHTGLPFLIALILWQKKNLRLFYLLASVVLGASALLGHFHYSIDVFAAFFITYAIFHIAKTIFPKDFVLVEKSAAPTLQLKLPQKHKKNNRPTA